MVTKKTQPAEQVEPALVDILDGKPVPFEIEGKAIVYEVDGQRCQGTAFQIRQPSSEEVDDAEHLYRVAHLKALAEPDVKALKDEPCSERERSLYDGLAELYELQAQALPADSALKGHRLEEAARLRELGAKRTAAEELAHDRALTVKERWLCVHLLEDPEGRRLFDPANPEDMARWRRFSLRVKEAARPAIRRALELVQEAPF